MVSHFKIACGAAAAMSLLMVAFVGRSSQPEPAPVVISDVQEPTTELKQARLELSKGMAMFTEEPKVITTEPIKAGVEAVVVVPPPKEHKKPSAKDLCTRHGRHKVWINKYKWRCRK